MAEKNSESLELRALALAAVLVSNSHNDIKSWAVLIVHVGWGDRLILKVVMFFAKTHVAWQRTYEDQGKDIHKRANYGSGSTLLTHPPNLLLGK